MRSVVTLWDSVSNSREYVSPARAYPAAGLVYLNQSPPSTEWLGASDLIASYRMPQIRTVYLYLSETLSGSVNIKIYGTGVVASSTQPNLYPYPAENIEETIAVQTAGSYESVNMYQNITGIEVLAPLTAAGPTTATLSVGLGSRGYIYYVNTDTNSSSPMHYGFQVEVESASTVFTHQGFVSARNPVTYLPKPPVGHYSPNYLTGWAMYEPVGTSLLLSSLDNYTASVADNIVGALAPVSVIWAYINDPAEDEEEEPTGQEGLAYITFLQQGSHA
jgi:hypothetical protein